MPNVLLDAPFLPMPVPYAVAAAAIVPDKGIYLAGYCRQRQAPVAYVFAWTERTDSHGHHVYELVSVQALAELQAATAQALAEMPVVSKAEN